MCGPKFCSMKISQEVRDFARLNPPRNGDGGAQPVRGTGEHRTDQAQPNGGGVALPPLPPAGGAGGGPVTEAEAEAGMAQMSEKYREGGDLYMPAK